MTEQTIRQRIDANRGPIVALAAAVLALLGIANLATDAVLFGADIVGMECTLKEPAQ